MVVPHFDQIENWLPGAIQLAVAGAPAGAQVLGLDEDTAVVGGPGDWLVMGRQSAWMVTLDGRREYTSGQRLG